MKEDKQRKLDLLTIKQLKRLVKDNKYDCLVSYTTYSIRDTLKLSKSKFYGGAYYLKDRKLGLNAIGTVLYNSSKEKWKVYISWISGKDISTIKPIITDEEIILKVLDNNSSSGGSIIYGYYPSVNISLDNDIEHALHEMKQNELFKTGREYGGQSEYYYDGQYYVECNSKYYSVEPVRWYFDVKNHMLICRDSIDNCGCENSIIFDTLDRIYKEMTQEIFEPNLLLSLDDIKGSLEFSPGWYSQFKNIIYSDFCNELANDNYYSNKYKYVPEIEYSEIKDMCSSVKEINGKTVFTFGEYPTKLVNIEILDKSNITGKYYTVNDYNSESKYFYPLSLPEFIYNGKKYVEYNNKYYEVEPLTWTLSSNGNYAVCDCALFPFMNKIVLDEDNYKHFIDILQKYLFKHFSKEIIPSKTKLEVKNVEKETDKEKIKEIIDSNPIYGMLYNKGLIDINNIEIDEENKLVLKK